MSLRPGHPEPDAMQVAREFALLAKEDEDAQFTSMKLQKLLYYAQAWSLYQRGRPIFWEKVKAWRDGPVVPQVYKEFQGAYWLSVNDPKLAELSGLSDDDREFVFSVWQMFKRYSGDELSDMTHKYAAYNRALERAKKGRQTPHRSPEIDRKDMSDEVKEYLRQRDQARSAFMNGLLKRESVA